MAAIERHVRESRGKDEKKERETKVDVREFIHRGRKSGVEEGVVAEGDKEVLIFYFVCEKDWSRS